MAVDHPPHQWSINPSPVPMDHCSGSLQPAFLNKGNARMAMSGYMSASKTVLDDSTVHLRVRMYCDPAIWDQNRALVRLVVGADVGGTDVRELSWGNDEDDMIIQPHLFERGAFHGFPHTYWEGHEAHRLLRTIAPYMGALQVARCE